MRSGLEKEPLQIILKERLREFVEKVSERMLKLQLEEDKELQKDIKQRDSLFILLEKMVGNAIIFTLVNSTYIFIFCCLIWVSKVIFSIDCNIS